MKKSLILGLGMVLMALQANVWAATCATEKKGKGYTLRVLSPGPGTVINKSAPFLLQWQDPAQSMGIKVNVSLHKLAGTKKTPKTIKNLLNQPNTGNVLLTGTNLTLPGKATATDQYFLRISGTGKLVIDSECFAFAPALKGGPKQQANAEQEALQLTVQTYATQIAALTKEVAVLKEQLEKTDTQGSTGEQEQNARNSSTCLYVTADYNRLTWPQIANCIRNVYGMHWRGDTKYPDVVRSLVYARGQLRVLKERVGLQGMDNLNRDKTRNLTKSLWTKHLAYTNKQHRHIAMHYHLMGSRRTGQAQCDSCESLQGSPM